MKLKMMIVSLQMIIIAGDCYCFVEISQCNSPLSVLVGSSAYRKIGI